MKSPQWMTFFTHQQTSWETHDVQPISPPLEHHTHDDEDEGEGRDDHCKKKISELLKTWSSISATMCFSKLCEQTVIENSILFP